jgi:hypothetical protein
MTPKQKANELIDLFLEATADGSFPSYKAKQCVLIAVDEIVKECYNWNGSDNVQWETKRFDYWEEVKQEIEKL